MRSDTGLHNLKHLWKGNVEHMMCVRGGLDREWFHSRLVSGVGVEGVKYCWNRCSSIKALKTSSQFFFHVAF